MSNIIDLSALRARDRIEAENAGEMPEPNQGLDEAAEEAHRYVSAQQAAAKPRGYAPPNDFSASGSIGASAGTELDVATAVVLLKARARIKGRDAIPPEVWLTLLSPEVGWRRAAERFVAEAAQARQAGAVIDLR